MRIRKTPSGTPADPVRPALGQPLEEKQTRSYRMRLTISEIRIETSLRDEDIPHLPVLAFHGTRTEELRHLDSADRFEGNFAVVNPQAGGASYDVEAFLKSVFASGNYMEMCLQTATVVIATEYGARKERKVENEGNLPVILVKKLGAGGIKEVRIQEVVDCSDFGRLKREGLFAIVQISKDDIDRIIQSIVRDIPESGYGWEIGRMYRFQRDVTELLAQRIVEVYERFAQAEPLA